ncbi:hypothetical protein BD626DRAFT_409871 [Schizophyllum amplum]|uniref:Uncharacterized protein n=1 Tax=Schizophyllum amplum TaxID=97359 RepID=A0A550C297_9AGAR|nr:hypothetical protein BD626DRAFT_409871 [Auriculariopsis ampla]
MERSSSASTSASVSPPRLRTESAVTEWDSWIAQAASTDEDEMYDDLNEEIAYQFKRAAPPKASWFYSVIYDRKFRREFSPQKGEIKLDTPYFRRLYAERKLNGLM